MKRLTISRIAAANLRNNRRSYLSMALGIVLAVMMITSMCMLAQGIMFKMQADVQDKVGEENGMLLAADGITDDALMTTGMFTNLAHVTNYASVADTNLYIGCYDDATWTMLHRRFLAGRAPQSEGEIAMEQMALYRLGLDNTQVGDSVTLPMADAEGNPTGETCTYTLCGILVNQSDNLNAEYYTSMNITPACTRARATARSQRLSRYRRTNTVVPLSSISCFSGIGLFLNARLTNMLQRTLADPTVYL